MKKILLLLALLFILGCDKTDENGFFIEGKKIGFNKETKSKYNKDGFDKDGFDKDGYNKFGFNKEGFDKNGYGRNGFNKDGFDKNSFDKNGFDKDGYDKFGFTRDGLDKENKFYKNKFYKTKFEEIKNYYTIEKFTSERNSVIKKYEELKKEYPSLRKGEFETSEEFNERSRKSYEIYQKLKDDIKNDEKNYFIFSKNFGGEYNADNEEWSFDIDITRAYGRAYDDTDDNSHMVYIIKNGTPIKETITLKMNRELAKRKQKEIATVKLLFTNIREVSSELNHSNHNDVIKSNFKLKYISSTTTKFSGELLGYQILIGDGTEQKLIQEVFLD